MGSYGFTSHGVKLDTELLVKLPEKLSAAIERAVDTTVRQTERIAVDLAHEITGAMKAGMYSVTSQRSGYAEAVGEAMAHDPKTVIIPEIPPMQPGEGAVSNATAQSVYEEFGTSKHGPHAFLEPAATIAGDIFVSNLEAEVAKELA